MVDKKKPEKAYESEKCEGEFKEHSSLVEGSRQQVLVSCKVSLSRCMYARKCRGRGIYKLSKHQ